jgi:hypothetical protein
MWGPATIAQGDAVADMADLYNKQSRGGVVAAEQAGRCMVAWLAGWLARTGLYSVNSIEPP